METAREPYVLVVDDTEQSRYVVSRILKHAGFCVTECATGKAALQFSGVLPDAIILDIKLPDLSGYEVCRRIKADPKTAAVPVLLISAAFDRGKQTEEMKWVGADDYVVQPVDPADLVMKVKTLVEKKKRSKDSTTG